MSEQRKNKPSTKMVTVYKDIQLTLGIKFEGDPNSFDDVHKFIDENIEAWRTAKDNQPPSEKQLKGINLITEKLGIEFEGTTKKEVSEFLDEHLKEALSKTKRGDK